MRMRKIIPVAGAAAAAAAIAITGAAGATAAIKNERFTLITTSTARPKPASVIATGAFIDGGIATHEPTGELTLHLTSGTITLDRKKGHTTQTHQDRDGDRLHRRPRPGFSYTIASGTGTTKGSPDRGDATEHAAFVEHVVHGNCSTNFAAVQGVVTVTGTVSLP